MARILVVDDDLESRSLLAAILTEDGHHVTSVGSAAEARAWRERTCPDLVILDIWLPDLSGMTLLKEWRSGGRLTMPVIVLSSYDSTDAALEATRGGASAFLGKPVSTRRLQQSVEEALASVGRDVLPAAPAVEDGMIERTIAGASVGGGARFPSPQARRVFNLDRPLREAREDFERSYFEFHLANANGNITRVADKTGIERTHLHRKLKQLGLDSRDGRLRKSGSV